MKQALLVIAGIAFSIQVHAQFVPCGDKSLPPEQSWNPPNSVVTPQLRRFYDLSDKMSAAYASSNPASAEVVAREYLQAAKSFRCNWNFGNATHDANSTLGLLALRDGKVDLAVQFLAAAGTSTGSPQLNSFGPSMLLANELVKAGRSPEVISYLRAIKRFWKMDQGSVDHWMSDLEAGRTPDFRMNLRPL